MNNTKTYNEHLERLNALRDEMLGIKHNPTAEERKAEAAYETAFTDMLHTGMPQNALKKGSDGTGGFLVPDTFEKTLVRGLTEKNLLRKLGTVMKTNKRMKIPKVIAKGSASWVPEGQPVPLTEATYGEIVLDAYKLAHKIIVSDEMLEDADFDIEDYIGQLAVESIGAAEEDAFFTGDGNGKPLGIVYQASVGTTLADINDLDFDTIIDLEHSLEPPYRENAVFIMSEEAKSQLMHRSHYRGRSPWTHLNEDEPDKLFGYSIFTTNQLSTTDGCQYPILFGDFSHYWIGERGKRSVKRLVERYADTGQIAYITSERVDAKLVLPEAVKTLEIKA